MHIRASVVLDVTALLHGVVAKADRHGLVTGTDLE